MTDFKSESNRVNTIIGQRFRAARLLCKMSEEDAIIRFGYKRVAQLNAIETGNRPAPTWLIMKASQVYMVSVDYIFGLADDPDIEPQSAVRSSIRRCYETITTAVVSKLADSTFVYLKTMNPHKADKVADLARDVALQMSQVRQRNPAFDDEIVGGSKLVSLIGQLRENADYMRRELNRRDADLERQAEKIKGLQIPLALGEANDRT